jgi:hypothetical protein
MIRITACGVSMQNLSCTRAGHACLLTLHSTLQKLPSFPRSDFISRQNIPPGERPAAVMDSSRWGSEQRGLRKFREHVGGHRPRWSHHRHTSVHCLPHRAELRFPERQELHRRRMHADQPAWPVLRGNDSSLTDFNHRGHVDSVDIRRRNHRFWVVRVVDLRCRGRFAPTLALTHIAWMLVSIHRKLRILFLFLNPQIHLLGESTRLRLPAPLGRGLLMQRVALLCRIVWARCRCAGHRGGAHIETDGTKPAHVQAAYMHERKRLFILPPSFLGTPTSTSISISNDSAGIIICFSQHLPACRNAYSVARGRGDAVVGREMLPVPGRNVLHRNRLEQVTIKAKNDRSPVFSA